MVNTCVFNSVILTLIECVSSSSDEETGTSIDDE